MAGSPENAIDLANPFESTFSIIVYLQDRIAHLTQQMQELQATNTTRFEKLEEDVDDLRQAKIGRFENVEKTVEELKNAKLARFDKVEGLLEELKAKSNSRFDRLGARVEISVQELTSKTEDLNRRIGQEASEWRARCKRIEVDAIDTRQISERDKKSIIDTEETLRYDLEQLANLVKDNSMSTHALKIFGLNQLPQRGKLAESGSQQLPGLPAAGGLNTNSPPSHGLNTNSPPSQLASTTASSIPPGAGNPNVALPGMPDP